MIKSDAFRPRLKIRLLTFEKVGFINNNAVTYAKFIFHVILQFITKLFAISLISVLPREVQK